MLPAAALLLVFLTIRSVWACGWVSPIPRSGVRAADRLENYEFLVTDSVFTLSVFNTFVYTVVASVIKSFLDVARVAAQHAHSFQIFCPRHVLLPFIVPTVLSAIAFWWSTTPSSPS